jgi:hypothetical protein
MIGPMVIRRSSLGRTLVVPPEVTLIVPMCHVLGEAVLSDVTDADRVLDRGPAAIYCQAGAFSRTCGRRPSGRW